MNENEKNDKVRQVINQQQAEIVAVVIGRKIPSYLTRQSLNLDKRQKDLRDCDFLAD